MDTMIGVVRDLAHQSTTPGLAGRLTPPPSPRAAEGGSHSASPRGPAGGPGGGVEAGAGEAGASAEAREVLELHRKAWQAGEQIQSHGFAR